MRLDKYSNPIFDETDLFDALYNGYQFKPTDTLIVTERSVSIKNLEEQLGFKFLEPYETHFNITDYDSACQSIWNMPDDYKSLDIENWLREQCPPWDPEHTRLEEELQAYKARNMLDLLRWLKYFVDTCSKEGVVWGLGRGSSVASYVLYLIGVHSIDPIKYNLDWQEFLR
jgi:DNA polymerase III alpha subunit